MKNTVSELKKADAKESQGIWLMMAVFHNTYYYNKLSFHKFFF